MRTFIFILTTTLLSFGLMSCEKDQLSITPSGHITTNTYTLASCDKLDVQDLFEVYVQFSPIGQGLVIEADDNLHHLVEINRRNGTLQIGLENNVEIHGRQPVLRAYVTTPDMNAIQASVHSGPSQPERKSA